MIKLRDNHTFSVTIICEEKNDKANNNNDEDDDNKNDDNLITYETNSRELEDDQFAIVIPTEVEGDRDKKKKRIHKRRMDSNGRDRMTAAVSQKTMRHKSRTAAGRRADRSIHSDTRSTN